MAEKRMFSNKITSSDSFIELSSAAQALYFHLNQSADDDGFNNQVAMAMFMSHASPDDLKVLLAKNFIIRFESGVIVIKHWRLHNTLRKDRYKPTNFQEELAQLGIKENGSYTLGCQSVANRLPNGCHSKVESSKEEFSKVKESVVAVEDNEDGNGNPPQLECLSGSLGRGVVYLTPEQDEKLLEVLGFDGYNKYIPKLADFIIEKGANVGNHYQTILKWYEEDTKV